MQLVLVFIFSFLLCGLTACDGGLLSSSLSNEFVTTPSFTPPVQTNVGNLRGLTIQKISPLTLMGQDELQLALAVQTSDGRTFSVDGQWQDESMDSAVPVIWSYDDQKIAWVDEHAVLHARGPGKTTVRASIGPYQTTLRVFVFEESVDIATGSETPPDSTEDYAPEIVEPEPAQAESPQSEPVEAELVESELPLEPDILLELEEPDNPTDHFLGSDDVITLTVGVGGGYGYKNKKNDPLYGPPTGNSVISLGLGGQILIEFHGFYLMDGPGADLTIFENPFIGFVELAEVELSADGFHWYSFDCAADNSAQLFPDCAGVTPVKVKNNPLDPLVSGGDSFDLADIGLPSAKFIRITDLETCAGTLPCADQFLGTGNFGFDLDAIAILNGVNE